MLILAEASLRGEYMRCWCPTGGAGGNAVVGLKPVSQQLAARLQARSETREWIRLVARVSPSTLAPTFKRCLHLLALTYTSKAHGSSRHWL